MGKVEYDFREGLDGSKRVYYDERYCNCSEFWGYIGYLAATWIWAAGWFALFLHAWLTDRKATFWAFIGIWFAFLIFLIGGFILPNLFRYYKQKAEKNRIKELEKKKKEDILLEAQGIAREEDDAAKNILEEKKPVDNKSKKDTENGELNKNEEVKNSSN